VARRRDPEDDARLARRIVLVSGEIDDTLSVETIAKLLFLRHQDRTRPIHLHVSSPGGNVTASLAILDAMDELETPIHTRCVGLAHGTALLILAHGARGERSAVETARLELSPLWGGRRGQHDPRELEAEVARLTGVLTDLLARDSGYAPDEVARWFTQRLSLEPAEALVHGWIDRVEPAGAAPG
jgi:ATP-dependent Clp protease protease subunit